MNTGGDVSKFVKQPFYMINLVHKFNNLFIKFIR
jgi:hypothetical protein